MNRNTITVGIAAVLLAGLYTLSSQAALIGYEPFLLGNEPNDGEYAGTNLGNPGQNPTVAGWTGPWNYHVSTYERTSLDTPGLSYVGIPAEGGALRLLGANVRVNREFSNILSNGWVYISFMMQLNNTNASYRVFELHSSAGANSDNNRTLQVGIGGSTGGDFPSVHHWGVRVNNDTNTNFFAQLAPKNTNVNFFVVKLEYNSGALNDRVLVWQNPALPTAEPATADAVIADIDLRNVRYMSLARFGDSTNHVTFDEIRVGETWGSVTAVQLPSTFLLLSFGSLLLWWRRRLR